MKNKKILLIAFKFPPYAGVGAKRWAKFSKYLARDGYQIHVVTAKWWYNGSNMWMADIDHPNIIVHPIPSYGLHNIKYFDFGKGTLGRLMSFIRTGVFRILSIFYYVDEAQFWGIHLLPYCTHLIKKEGIKNVVATGAPFMANYWAAHLKKKNPDINLIQDFRDPWNDDPVVHFPLNNLKKRAIRKELFAVNCCDHLISVSEKLTQDFDVKRKKNNCITVYNGYDDEQCRHVKISKFEEFEIIYAGNVASGRHLALEPFLYFIRQNQRRYPDLKLSFYGYFPRGLKKKYVDLFTKKIAFSYRPIPPADIMEKISRAFLALQLTAPIYQDALSSKLFEYAALKRPVLCINNGGEVDAVIKRYHLGSSVRYDDSEAFLKVLDTWYDLWKSDPLYSLPEIDIRHFAYSRLVKDVEALLQ